MQAMRDHFLGKVVLMAAIGHKPCYATVLDINEAGVTFCMHTWPSKNIQFITFAAQLSLDLKQAAN
jgi:hypothetical protein